MIEAVDLRSDTVTKPSQAMREVIARAEVGDDVLGDDSTTDAFQERVAALLGQEAALFFPSGTQANQTALAVLSEPGTEVVLEARSHIVDYEDSAAAVLSGLQLRTVSTPDGRLAAGAVAEAIRPADPFLPRTSVVAVENTHLDSGGTVMGPEELNAIVEVARAASVRVHLDGARLWNAAAAAGVPVDTFGREVDTVMVSLSKGLGAPIGSILAGSESVIDRARRVRRRFGGAMRQTGLLTAAAAYALDHNLERIPEDHERARRLALAVDDIDGLVTPTPETNVVFISVDPELMTGPELIERARERGVLLSSFGPQRVRAVTHLGVDDAGVDRALEVLDSIAVSPAR